MEKIKITGKNVLVGVSKTLFWASIGFAATNAVYSVVRRESFVDTAKYCLTDNTLGYIAAAPFMLFSAWGYTYEDAMDFSVDLDND